MNVCNFTVPDDIYLRHFKNNIYIVERLTIIFNRSLLGEVVDDNFKFALNKKTNQSPKILD